MRQSPLAAAASGDSARPAPPAISIDEYSPMTTPTWRGNCRLMMPGNTACTTAAPRPSMAAVPISCQPAEAHSRSDEPAASSQRQQHRAPAAKARLHGRPAKATSPISSMGTSVSSDMRLRSRPVCAPISAASGPMPAMKGRRFSATRAMAAKAGGGRFPARVPARVIASCLPVDGLLPLRIQPARPARHRHVPDPHGRSSKGLARSA